MAESKRIEGEQMRCICPHCNVEFEKQLNYVNRAKKLCVPLYCSRVCSGLARRKNITPEQFKANKQAYDIKRRNGEKRQEILDKKNASWKANYDPVKAAEYRQKRMPYHVEYCRQPHYKAKKIDYDKKHRAEKHYGDFADAFLLTEQIFGLIDNREIKYMNGLTNKSQIRKRKWKTQLNNQNLPQMPSKALFGKH